MKNLRWFIFGLLVAIGMVLLWQSQQERLERHNKYQCAVYGMQADCKTPLAPEDRLK